MCCAPVLRCTEFATTTLSSGPDRACNRLTFDRVRGVSRPKHAYSPPNPEMSLAILMLLASLHAPAAQRYRISVVALTEPPTSNATRASFAGTRTEMTSFIAMTMSDSAAGQLVTIVLDSMHLDGGEMLRRFEARMKAPPGTVLHAYLVGGRLQGGVQSAAHTAMAKQLEEAIGLMFVPSPVNAKTGDTWSDTLKLTENGSASGTTFARKWNVAEAAGDVRTVDAVVATSIGGEGVAAQGSGVFHGTIVGNVIRTGRFEEHRVVDQGQVSGVKLTMTIGFDALP